MVYISRSCFRSARHNTGCDRRTDRQTRRCRKDRAMHSVARAKSACRVPSPPGARNATWLSHSPPAAHLPLQHGRIQTCPLQTNGRQKRSHQIGFVSLAGLIPKCSKTCMKSHKIVYVMPQNHSGWGSALDSARGAYDAPQTP